MIRLDKAHAAIAGMADHDPAPVDVAWLRQALAEIAEGRAAKRELERINGRA